MVIHCETQTLAGTWKFVDLITKALKGHRSECKFMKLCGAMIEHVTKYDVVPPS